ncbi:hypothetical protein Tco_0183102, partial [Tanacetum coccineum]
MQNIIELINKLRQYNRADRQQQRDPNRDRRRAADKYRFNSKEIRTEVDEEQQTNTDSAAERSEQ